MRFKIVSHKDEIKNMTDDTIQTVLELCGQTAEYHATTNVPVGNGTLKNSIAHKVVNEAGEKTVYVGTDEFYAPYVELGTGIYGTAKTGGYWVYVKGGSDAKKNTTNGKRYSYDEARQIVAMMRAKGLDAYMTQGQKPTHFLKKSFTNFTDEYKDIIVQGLKNML